MDCKNSIMINVLNLGSPPSYSYPNHKRNKVSSEKLSFVGFEVLPAVVMKVL
jgi:hypothetical protein